VTSSQLILAFVADLAFGDPPWVPHPVQLFGLLTQGAEKLSRKIAHSNRALLLAGLFTAVGVSVATGAGAWALLSALNKQSSFAGYAATVYLAYAALSVRGLDQAGKKVIDYVKAGKLAEARSALAMIVGRDTQALSATEIVRAVVETVAENTSDGFVAPMFYMSLGGVPAALTYKAINTLDSMIGYKNDRYFYFGRTAARLDDIVNLVPSRLTALLVAIAAVLLRFSWRKSFRIVDRDARLQPSPNSGFPEAAFAGALRIRLGGLNTYDGRPVQKAYLGDPERELTAELYPEVREVLYSTAALMLVVSLGIAAIMRGFVWHL
jgi:adenosylcobinamide-phosphate synthase